ARAAGGPAAAQEARCKQAFCEVQLRHPEEAAALFERVAAEDGPRWPAVAACQLWLVRLRQQRTEDAEARLDGLTTDCRCEQLVQLVPSQDRERILQNYRKPPVVDLLRTNPRLGTNLDRAAAAEKLLGASLARRIETQGMRIRVNEMAG